ncbi:MAG: hypothetical protein U0800_00565 [Isosphaeraceae bacterium]
MARVAAGTPPRSWGSRLVHALMLPAYLVEQARGPKRLALLALYAMVALPIGLLAWREAQILGIPDIGDPFDTKPLLERRVRDEDNAFVLYREAAAQFKPQALAWGAGLATPTSPAARQQDWLEANAEALATWKRATGRPDALDTAPADLRASTPTMTVQLLQEFARLASLEARRLRDEGDMAGALDLDLAILRSAKHAALAGPLVARFAGLNIRSMACRDLDEWAAEPRVDAELLRRALDAASRARADQVPISHALRYDYLATLNSMAEVDPALEGKDWHQSPLHQAFPAATRLSCWLLHEPERGRRVYRLWMANLLAYCDRPRDERPSQSTGRFPFYLPEGDAAPEAHRLAPEELARQIEASPLARIFISSAPQMIGYLDREALQEDALVLTLAERLYTLEQGHPPKVMGDLLGKYLGALPEGNSPTDPPFTSTEPIADVAPR